MILWCYIGGDTLVSYKNFNWNQIFLRMKCPRKCPVSKTRTCRQMNSFDRHLSVLQSAGLIRCVHRQSIINVEPFSSQNYFSTPLDMLVKFAVYGPGWKYIVLFEEYTVNFRGPFTFSLSVPSSAPFHSRIMALRLNSGSYELQKIVPQSVYFHRKIS